jgi:hypothetical protein
VVLDEFSAGTRQVLIEYSQGPGGTHLALDDAGERAREPRPHGPAAPVELKLVLEVALVGPASTRGVLAGYSRGTRACPCRCGRG